jgi:hypothetical protein
MDWPSLIESLRSIPWVPLVTGGAAGAVLTHYFSLKRQRTELTFKVLEQFFKGYPELGTVKTHLQGGNVQRNTSEYNQVTAVGDWFEIVSLFYREKWIDRKILRKSGFITEVRSFRDLAATNKALDAAISNWREMKSVT